MLDVPRLHIYVNITSRSHVFFLVSRVAISAMATLGSPHPSSSTRERKHTEIKDMTCRGHASPEAFHLQVREREREREFIRNGAAKHTKDIKALGKR
jgi:hypothetical protein